MNGWMTELMGMTGVLALMTTVGTLFVKLLMEEKVQKRTPIKPLPLPSGRDLQELRDGRSYRHLEATQKFDVEEAV